ncbi:MAG: hypothetical protein ACYS8W_09520, partial [Planctomycetota bacterium]
MEPSIKLPIPVSAIIVSYAILSTAFWFFIAVRVTFMLIRSDRDAKEIRGFDKNSIKNTYFISGSI